MGWFGALFEGGKNKKESTVEKKSSTPVSVSPEKRMAAIRDVARAGQKDVETRQAKAREIVDSLAQRGIQTKRLETIKQQGGEFDKFFSESGTLVDAEVVPIPSPKPAEVLREQAPIVKEVPKPKWEHSGKEAVVNGPEQSAGFKVEGLVAAHGDEEIAPVISLAEKRAEREVPRENPAYLRDIAKANTRAILDKEMNLRELQKKGENQMTQRLAQEIAQMRADNSELFKKIVALERDGGQETARLDKAA